VHRQVRRALDGRYRSAEELINSWILDTHHRELEWSDGSLELSPVMQSQGQSSSALGLSVTESAGVSESAGVNE
jgi:hypothetical protein